MPDSHRSHLRTLAALMLVLGAALFAAAPDASAAPYGELGHIGTRGTGKGQFDLFPGETDAIGVDPTDNSVYVVDLPSSNGALRIQKFAANAKGEFKFLAAATFKPAGSSGSEAAPVEGVAVDPVMHRVYVLALNEKPKEPDKSEEVASELFAFSTEQKGEELPPVAGSTGGVVASTEVLKVKATKFEESLLEPTGIAVEPIDATHDTVDLLGTVDTGKKAENGVAILHSAVWRVGMTEGSEGKLLDEQRFVDTTEVLEDEARSPVVFNKKLYVQGEEGIYEIPSSGPPKSLTQSTPEREEWWEEQLGGLWQTPSIQAPFLGAGMTVGPEGTFWTTASIKLASNKNNFFPGAVSYDQTGQVLGWTGGQSPAGGLEKCMLRIAGTPLVAAGKEWTPGAGHVLFMLDDNLSFPRLIEMGPGGEGCPTAQAASPTAAVGGVPVEESQTIPIAATVELESKLTQADALSAEWNFGDGSAPVTVTKPAHQSAFITHKFANGGTHTVTVKIHTDDLAEPTVEVTSHVTIEAKAAQPPTATTGGSSALSSTAELVKGAVNPNGSSTTCLFEYGTTTSYGKTAACKTQPGSGETSVLVEAELAGLAESTTYHYRLLAENSAKEKGTGADKEFTTSTSVAPAPKVKTEPASSVGPNGATLNAKVDPEGSEVTECKLEYGPTEAYGSSVPCTPPPGSGSSSVAVSGAVTGLTANTTYHFRVRAKNSNPTAVFGADVTFKTSEPPAPKVKTEPATGVTAKAATLNAKVDPEGSEVTECKLEYGTSEAYGSSVPCSPPPGSGSSDVGVSGAISGLTANTTYHFRVRAKNSNATASLGADTTLKTSEPPAPKVKTEPASGILAKAATLNATVNPEGSEVTECKLEYGTSEAYGSSVPCSPPPGSGSSDVAVSGAISGLTPNTTYHFRVRAKNANPTASTGSDATFKTTEEGESAPPKVKTEPASAIGANAATLNATVDPEGTEVTECKLEYGTSEAYGSSVPCSPPPGSGTSVVPVSGAVSGLTASTTYHFRVRAKNSNATASLGADTTLKTSPEGEPPAPKVKTEPATGVEQTAAALNAIVDPEGSEVTECKLEYGTSEAYGSSVPCSPPPGSGSSDVPVSGAVSGLTAGTTYHFRVRAKNSNATASLGADTTFKTGADGEPPAPKVITQPAGAVGPTAATLKASVDAEGSLTECRFEYGTTTAYGSTAICTPTPSSGSLSFEGVAANVGGLSQSTTYHFRVWAKNANATPAVGADATFTTSAKSSEVSPGAGEGEAGAAGGSPAPASTPPAGGGVKGAQEASPDAHVAGSATFVATNGAFVLQISCPAGAGTCSGSVVVKTAGAVAASARGSLPALVASAVREVGGVVRTASDAAAAHESIMTLSSGSFSVSGGHSKPVVLHLSAKARKLLAKLHVLRAKVTITAHNAGGAKHTSVSTVLLKAKKKH
ncbi:MAG TPA: PKD domain-containing protein [Solirubrobacteraceae bacterium]|nr:PKD domain-containing protein [Solirubrobacteraceae bacterium]